MIGPLVVILALLEAAGIATYLYLLGQKQTGSGRAVLQKLAEEKKKRQAMLERFETLFASMVDVPTARSKYKDFKSAQDALKAERGRITITQAELETVENRLRELEEIERELEASGLETKEEMNILDKKQKDIKIKNEQLKTQISRTMEQLDQLMREVQMSAAMQEQVSGMKTELIQTEQQTDMLSVQIEQGNEQYFILKHRYDALDIEYAQLYEKFSEAEALASVSKKEE